MSKYFGIDGFCDEANRTLTAEHAYRIGRFLGHEFGEGVYETIGKDTRRSSYMLEYMLAAGLAASGVNILLFACDHHVQPFLCGALRASGWWCY